jgi:hypothetical protein
MKDPEAFQVLFRHQATTTSRSFVNVNGYYVLGVLSQRMMRSYDPFLRAGNVSQCISNATLYFSLAKHYLTEAEVKKNTQFYEPIVPNATFEAVKQDIEARQKDVEEFKHYFTQNSRYLNTGIRNYNACIEFFGRINQQNSRLYDLYFLADNALINNLNELEHNFNTTIANLDSLKASLEKYDMGGYHISYVLEPVQVYRLHGLTPSNFLAARAQIWDYAAWVNAFRQMLNTDVAFLYQQADAIHDTASLYINRLARQDRNGVPAEYTVNPLIINKIYRYDYNTVVAPLLKYREWKVRFLYQIASNEWDNSLFAVNEFAPSNAYYFDLITKKMTADSMLAFTRRNTKPAAIAKYRDFFNTHYEGYSGFSRYLEEERTSNDATLHTTLDAYKDAVVLARHNTSVRNSLIYNDLPLYTDIVLPDDNFGAGYYIHHKTVLPNGKVLATGTHVTKERARKAFVSVINNSPAAEWVQILGGDAETGLLAVAAGIDYVVITHSGGDGDDAANHLYQLDFKGAVKKQVALSASSIPRQCIYNDIGQEYVLSFNGVDIQSVQTASHDNITLLTLNAEFAEVWKTALPLAGGYFVNTIRTNDRFYVYSATLRDGKMLAQVNVVNANGDKAEQQVFDVGFSYYPLHVSKINNEYADMIAVKDSPDGTESFYMIVTSSNKSVFVSRNRGEERLGGEVSY